jgi:hypothetical protein
MINSSRLLFSLVFVFNILISLLFFYKGTTQSYADLASDQLNIIPMCMKLDNPNLYKGDLFLDDIDNFKYYTPFFVEPLMFLKHQLNINYYQTINLLHSLLHVIFGLCWFLLFYLLTKKNFLISFFLSVLVRGIIWLPGMEIWGISEVWSFMPRTVYIALMPIPFLILFSKIKYKILLAGLTIGLVFNFHPITGLGGILIMLYSVFYFQQKKHLDCSLVHFISFIFFVIVGMIPFLVNYFLKTDIVSNYDLNLYNSAFDERIPSYFTSVYYFFIKWINFKTLFIIVPIILLYCIPLFSKIRFKHRNFILILFTLLFTLPLLSIWVENTINSILELNLRMSFQLVRIQKLVVIPGYLAMLYILNKLYKSKVLHKKTLSFTIVIYLLIIPFSNLSFFNTIPFISDDLTKMILPNFTNQNSDSDIIEMGAYIEEQTPKNAVFYNTTILRTISNRAVRLDYKGASILIEGNPNKLIDWYLSVKKLNQIKDDKKKSEYLNSLGVDYILSENKLNLKEIKSIGKYRLYEVHVSE